MQTKEKISLDLLIGHYRSDQLVFEDGIISVLVRQSERVDGGLTHFRVPTCKDHEALPVSELSDGGLTIPVSRNHTPVARKLCATVEQNISYTTRCELVLAHRGDCPKGWVIVGGRAQPKSPSAIRASHECARAMAKIAQARLDSLAEAFFLRGLYCR